MALPARVKRRCEPEWEVSRWRLLTVAPPISILHTFSARVYIPLVCVENRNSAMTRLGDSILRREGAIGKATAQNRPSALIPRITRQLMARRHFLSDALDRPNGRLATRHTVLVQPQHHQQ